MTSYKDAKTLFVYMDDNDSCAATISTRIDAVMSKLFERDYRIDDVYAADTIPLDEVQDNYLAIMNLLFDYDYIIIMNGCLDANRTLITFIYESSMINPSEYAEIMFEDMFIYM